MANESAQWGRDINQRSGLWVLMSMPGGSTRVRSGPLPIESCDASEDITEPSDKPVHLISAMRGEMSNDVTAKLTDEQK